MLNPYTPINPENFQLPRLKLSMRLGPMSDLHQGSQVEDLLHVGFFQPPLETGKGDKRRPAKPRLA
jgi:hypothetical protein